MFIVYYIFYYMFDFGKRCVIWVVCGVLLPITFFIWWAIYSLQESDVLIVTFLDVGQGDSIFIQAPSGVQVLIDGGATSGVLRELATIMPFYDRSIDMVVATHPDTDHIGGLLSVLKRFKVSRILRPGVEHSAPAAESLLLAIAREQNSGAIETLAKRGQVYDLGTGNSGARAELHILFPDRDVNGLESNSASIVARLVYGDTSMLLTGDSPKSIEKYLVGLDGEDLQSNILKLGHHGSKTSTSERFLGFVDPQWAIVSASKDNGYGHPHKSVVDMVERFGIIIKNTADNGSISFESNGSEWRLQ